jgi:hypothetical protein
MNGDKHAMFQGNSEVVWQIMDLSGKSYYTSPDNPKNASPT